ncbi:MAG: HD domain-containing protein [Lachnospiraceae bacterium]|nr:HD domain-containing protein [Lachnospiraceae bacterium]
MADKKTAPKLFAALDVGSFELCLKIVEIRPTGVRQLEYLRHRLALGSDSYATKKIGLEKTEELFRILQEFKDVMKSYHIREYRAYGTSALRETENTEILLDQIRNRSGIELSILSNSEQRFLDYKAIAAGGELFDEIIAKPTAIADIGGGSIQLSLFDKGRLVSTQSLKLGVLRLHERLQVIQPRSNQVEALLDEMINGQLSVFRRLYMKDKEVKNLIVMDDYLSPRLNAAIKGAGPKHIVSFSVFQGFCTGLLTEGDEELSERIGLPEESVPLLRISAGIMRRVAESFSAEALWAPGTSLCDGIAYEYAEKFLPRSSTRDFEQDILACASAISKRYLGSRRRSEAIEASALAIFDGMQKIHGMGERERLLLRLSAILHDCGKFINMTNVGDCSYSIIMNTEMIGLSHLERETVALVVRFNHEDFEYYDELSTHSDISEEVYLVIAKLTAILRIANALDKSQRQKVRKLKAVLREDTLEITVDAGADLLFEQERFLARVDFFEEVYGVHPRIRREG